MDILKGKKIELLPVKILNEKTQKHCSKCEGIGWVMEDKGHIKSCWTCGGMGFINFCEECGNDTHSAYRTLCETCWRKQREKEKLKEEQSNFNQSVKLVFGKDDEKINSFNMFYSEHFPYNEGYFSDFDEFFEALDEENTIEDKRPYYVWGTFETQINIDVETLLEDACEDLHEEAYSSIDEKDFKELEQFIENWCKKQTQTTTYYPNFKYSIIIPWEEY